MPAVEPTVARKARLDRSRDVAGAGHVTRERQRLGPDRGGHLLNAVPVEVEQHHLGALARKGARDLGAEARCRAGHQRNFARDPHVLLLAGKRIELEYPTCLFEHYGRCELRIVRATKTLRMRLDIIWDMNYI